MLSRCGVYGNEYRFPAAGQPIHARHLRLPLSGVISSPNHEEPALRLQKPDASALFFKRSEFNTAGKRA